ncbi:MAG: hypothetical protein E7220_07345, partial [Clostridiales bacterium]|nr:hypothetical protein [Clostridiales bacterium]
MGYNDLPGNTRCCIINDDCDNIQFSGRGPSELKRMPSNKKDRGSKKKKKKVSPERPAEIKNQRGAYDMDSFSFEEYDDYKEFIKWKRNREKDRDKDSTAIQPDNRARLAGGFAFLLLLMIVLIFRMGYWQIVRADELRLMATDMQKVDTEIEPVRGNIYDSNMNLLAESVTDYELYGYTQYLYKSMDISTFEKEQTVKNLVRITGKDEETIRDKLQSEENLTLLAEGLTKDQVDRAQKMWEGKVIVKTKAARYYPNGAFAAEILGGVNSDNVGRAGLEYEYNSVLAGVKGRTVRTTDPDGNTLPNSKAKYYDARDGESIVTTIDSVIQHFVEEALETGMKKTGAEAITCIVSDPRTGDIIAMASTPEYDPNNSSEPSSPSEKKKFRKMSSKEQSEYLSRMWTIRGISNIYEPGSTFKLITASAALESASAKMNSKYTCNGSIRVGNYNLNCLWTHGKQTLKEAVGNSCNPALAQVALDMGAKTFYNYI